MKWSWRVATIFGIDVKVHVTFVLALAWGAVMWGDGHLSGIAYAIFLTLLLFLIVVLHELGHSLAARRYGIPVFDIVLLPIGGVARLSRMPEKPNQELVVALAGPLVNLGFVLLTLPIVVGGVLWQAWHGLPADFPAMMRPGALNLAAFLLMVNLSLLVFNLIPAFPMDGGRVLRALLAMRVRQHTATRVAVTVGQLFAVGFGVLAILTGNLFMGIVAFFVFSSAAAEGREDAVADAHGPLPYEASPLRLPVLLDDTPAYMAFERLTRSPYAALAVVDYRGDMLGLVTRGGMQSRWAAGVRGPVKLFVERPVQVGQGFLPFHERK